MNNIILIFLTIILILGVLFLIYILLYNNLQTYKIKINEAESIIDDLLRKKYNLLLNLQKIIIKKTNVDKKIFNDLKKLEKENISSFDFERKLTAINNIVEQIKIDYIELEKDKGFYSIYNEIFTLNERLESAEVYYNRQTSNLNKLIKKFPSNLIAKIHHIYLHTYFDGKDLFDENINDFKV